MHEYRERQKKIAAKRRALVLRKLAAQWTLEEIGNFLGISKQRVCQLAKQARAE